MPETVRQRVLRWDSEFKDSPQGATRQSTFARVLERINYFEDQRYVQYLPGSGTMPRFRDRLALWLDGVSESDQKKLLRFVPKVFFVGREEQEALFRAAFQGPIIRWLIDVCNINLIDSDWGARLDEAISTTWFCSITDSMQTNAFLKSNQINGVADGTALKSIMPIIKDDNQALVCLMQNRPIALKRLVLLEDFVGSGLQMKPVLRCAAALEQVPVLVVPLVCCRGGAKVGTKFAARHQHISFDPVLVLNESAGLNKTSIAGEDPIFAEVRPIVTELFATGKVTKSPFGFDGDGPLYISYTNCPNNAPPFLHVTDDTSWYPLFPRVNRVTKP